MWAMFTNDLSSIAGDKVPIKHSQQQTESPRPKLHELYAKALPINVYPLPPLIPHNPLSLVHIAFIYFSNRLRQPRSHPDCVITGYFSPETQAVHVVEQDAIRWLWERGFFGKGSLSRSEPTWLTRQKAKHDSTKTQASEQVTNQRREERRQFKRERARQEQLAIDAETQRDKKDFSGPSESSSETSQTPEAEVDDSPHRDTPSTEFTEPRIASSADDDLLANEELRISPEEQAQKSTLALRPSNGNPETKVFGDQSETDTSIINQEHLQLTFEETFFLVYGLGVLQVWEQHSLAPITTDRVFTLFRQYSHFPPCSSLENQPDDPFLLSYVVYHHFRSLGWVVRSGIKFAVDWLLYLRGPVFAHAEFAVRVLPSYQHAYWNSSTDTAKRTQRKQGKSWHYLHGVNRVQTHVHKSLVLAYVEIPPPIATRPQTASNISETLKTYKVRTLVFKRWTPNRMRD